MSNIEFGSTASGLHDEVMKLMVSEKKGVVLDAPSGEGELAYLLKQEGFDAIAGDIDENVVKAKGIRFQKLDLNTRLPFEDGELDYIINIEGVEHLENPHHTLREFARILKPGGKIIMSTPNVLNVFSRLRYLLIGYHEHFGGYYADESSFYTLHINPVGIPEISFALKQNNLAIEEVSCNRSVMWVRGFFVGLLLLMIKGIVTLITKLKVKEDMKALFLSKPVLEGEILILKCRKDV